MKLWTDYFWYLIGIVLFFISLFVFFDFMNQNPSSFFNSDAYYFPMLYRDIFIDEFPIDGWSLATATCFFPDMLIFFILAIFSDEITALYIWPIAWTILWALLCSNIMKFVVKKRFVEIFPVFLILSSFLLLIASMKSDLFMKWLYSFVHPHGSVLMALSGLYILFLWFKKKSGARLILLALLIYIATASDKIFVPIFLIPAFILITLEGFMHSKKTSAIALFVIITSAYLGIKSMELFRSMQWFYFASVQIKPEHLNFDYLNWFTLLYTGLWHGLSTPGKILIFISAFFSLFFILRNFSSFWTLKKSQRTFISYTIIFIWISTFSVITLSGIVGMIAYKDPIQMRYLSGVYSLHFIILAIFLFTITSLPNKDFRFLRMFILSFFVIVLFADTIFNKQFFKNGNYVYMDPLAQCLDENKNKYDLKYGIADYWNAKAVTLFSKKTIKINQTTPDLKVYHWVNNLWWYIGKTSKPEYNFIITEKLHLKSIHSLFGFPNETFTCATRTIFVYNNKDSDLAKYLNKDSITKWKKDFNR